MWFGIGFRFKPWRVFEVLRDHGSIYPSGRVGEPLQPLEGTPSIALSICTVNASRNSDIGAKHLDEIGPRLHKKSPDILKSIRASLCLGYAISRIPSGLTA
jgi:hypothetical protein